ncbi:MAG: glycosyltransferase [Flavobacteriales bacterium]
MYNLIIILEWAGLFCVAIYAFTLYFFLFLKVGASSNGVITYAPRTIIIPFRNEKENIQQLVESLIKQTEQSNREVEVVLIDDHSSDGSFDLVGSLIKHRDNFVLSKSPGEGKKAAIRFGIGMARFDRVITLDADVVLSESWLEQALHLQNSSLLNVLPVQLKTNTAHWFERVEWDFLQGITLLSAENNRALMCNGAHLEFSRSLFEKEIPNEHSVSSGDDIFLLEIAKKTGKVGVCFQPKMIVQTYGSSGWKEFLSRRVRWSGKNMRVRDNDMLAFGVVYSIAQVFALIALCIGDYYPLIVKVLVEMAVFIDAKRRINLPSNVMAAFSYLALLPFYTLLIFGASIFYKPKWKGRDVKS